MRTLITGLGEVVSGDIAAPLLDADSILIEDGRIAAVGRGLDEDADVVIDGKGSDRVPGPHRLPRPPRVRRLDAAPAHDRLHRVRAARRRDVDDLGRRGPPAGPPQGHRRAEGARHRRRPRVRQRPPGRRQGPRRRPDPRARPRGAGLRRPRRGRRQPDRRGRPGLGEDGRPGGADARLGSRARHGLDVPHRRPVDRRVERDPRRRRPRGAPGHRRPHQRRHDRAPRRRHRAARRQRDGDRDRPLRQRPGGAARDRAGARERRARTA